MQKIGLTGNIAAGKSEAQKIIQTLGFEVIDLDEVSHNLLDFDDEIKTKVMSAFNTLERKKIAAVVFSDLKEKEKLEGIFFPRLKEFVLDYFKNNQDKKAVFVSGALLFEAGFGGLFNKTIYIDAPDKIRLARLMKRNSISEKEAKKRMDCQKDTSGYADFIIQNDEDLEKLKEKILNIFEKLML